MLSVGGVLTRLYATHANILSSCRSTTSRGVASVQARMLLYRSKIINYYESRTFGNMLSPGKYSARNNLTSELLRYL